LSNCVPFRAGDFGFTTDCVAQCENILSIDQVQIDLAAGPLGILDATALRNVKGRMAFYWLVGNTNNRAHVNWRMERIQTHNSRAKQRGFAT